MSHPKLTVERVIEEAKRQHGNRSRVAKRFGVSRQAVSKFAKTHPEVAAVFDEALAEMVDLAESKLYAALVKGQAWAICFTLKTQSKDRGYVERAEVTGRDGGPIDVHTIQIVPAARREEVHAG